MIPSQETQHLTAFGEAPGEAVSATAIQYWKDRALTAQQAVAVLKEAVETLAHPFETGWAGQCVERHHVVDAAQKIALLALRRASAALGDHSAGPTPDRGGEGGAS